MIYKTIKIRLYPNKIQAKQIDKTIHSCRFLYNNMLAERIKWYENNKYNKEKLYNHKYKTEKEYKNDFEWLKDVSSYALQQTRINLENNYKLFFKKIKQHKKTSIPKFKSKKKTKWTYREPKIGNYFEIKNNKIKLAKLKWIKFRGQSKYIYENIQSITIEKTKTNKYYGYLLIKTNKNIKKYRINNNIIGLDLGLSTFAVTSNKKYIVGIKEKIKEINNKISIQQQHLSRKKKESNNWKKCKIKLNKLYEYRKNFINHFQWNLANKLCSENQAISIESLNIEHMKYNKYLSFNIHNINWRSFVDKLKKKSIEYNTIIYCCDKYFPSTKKCSNCGNIKEKISLKQRIYSCGCGLNIDRDLNAALNLKKEMIKNISLEYNDYNCGETIRPLKLYYNFEGNFCEAILDK